MDDSQYLLSKEMLELNERKEQLENKLKIYRDIHCLLLSNTDPDLRDRFITSDVANLIVSLQTQINTQDIRISNCRGEIIRLLQMSTF